MEPTQEPGGVVLVADNDPGVGGLLREVLVLAGLRCESVADGVAALERLREGGIALLVTDLDMPRMDGRALLEELAGWPKPPPSLVVSGFVDPEIEAGLLGLAGVQGVLRKPFDILAFRDRVQALVASKKGPDHA